MESFKQHLLKEEMNKKRGEVIKIAGRTPLSPIDKPSVESPRQPERFSGVSNLTTSPDKSMLNKSGNFNQTNAGFTDRPSSEVPARVTEDSVARNLPQQEIASSPTSKTLTNNTCLNKLSKGEGGVSSISQTQGMPSVPGRNLPARPFDNNITSKSERQSTTPVLPSSSSESFGVGVAPSLELTISVQQRSEKVKRKTEGNNERF